MDEVVYSGRWISGDYGGIPAASGRALDREDRAEAREEAERQAHAEDRLDQAAFLAQQDGRDVTLAGVFARAQRSMAKTDHEAARADLLAKARNGEVEILDRPDLARSAGRDTGYAETRLIRQLDDNHRWMTGYLARHNYPAALEAARATSTYYGTEATRYDPDPYRAEGSYDATIVRGVEGAIRGVW